MAKRYNWYDVWFFLTAVFRSNEELDNYVMAKLYNDLKVKGLKIFHTHQGMS